MAGTGDPGSGRPGRDSLSIERDLLKTGRPWFWPAEVAVICQVSRQTVYRWIERGVILPILKVRPFKIPREEVEKLLN